MPEPDLNSLREWLTHLTDTLDRTLMLLDHRDEYDDSAEFLKLRIKLEKKLTNL